MAKLPFMQFFPKDWLFDTRILTPEEKAVLIDLICFMWDAPERGVIKGPREDISRMLGISFSSDAADIFESLKRKNMLDVSSENGIVTLVSRRIRRDENKRESHNLRQKRYREKAEIGSSDAKVTGRSHISEVRSQNKPPLPPTGGRFEEFWKSYPKKIGKGAAEKSFKKGFDGSTFYQVMGALERAKKTEQWRKDGGQFVPNPATWLNQKRWLDEGFIPKAPPRPAPVINERPPMKKEDMASPEEVTKILSGFSQKLKAKTAVSKETKNAKG